MTLQTKWLAVFLSAFVAANVLAHPADDQPSTIRVVVENSYAPYSFLSDDGRLQGILIDQWQAWEKKTGIKAEIHAMDWNEAMQRMRAGEFDVIDDIVETPERLNYFDFSPSYSTIETSIYFRDDITGIVDLASLKGFPVGLKAGDERIDRLKANGVSTVIQYKNNREIVEAANERKINVFVVDGPSAQYFLQKLGIENEFRQSAPVFHDEVRRAVRKGNLALLRKVSDGFAAIDPDDLKHINEKWLGYPINPWGNYLTYASYAALAAILLIAGLIGWNRRLKQGIEERTVALGETELRLRQIAENIREVFWIATPAMDEVLYVSPAYESIWGRSVQSLRQQPQSIYEAIHAEDRESALDIIKGHREQGFDIEYRIVRPDGSVRWIRDRGFPVQDASGKVVRIAGVADEITEHKRDEIAIRNTSARLQALSRRLVELQEFERNELARELHDRVGQNLTAIGINLTLVAMALPPDASPDLAARIEDSRSLVETTAGTTRDILRDLRPSTLEEYGLLSALRMLASNFYKLTSIRTTVHGSDNTASTPKEVNLALFRIVQEALNNVAKHAKATHVEISLELSNPAIKLTITDNGVGFDRSLVESNGTTPHWGLLIMRERAAAIGASFTVNFIPSGGVQILVEYRA